MNDTSEWDKNDYSWELVGYNMTGQPCGGDSGGPAIRILDDGQHLLLGTIFGMLLC